MTDLVPGDWVACLHDRVTMWHARDRIGHGGFVCFININARALVISRPDTFYLYVLVAGRLGYVSVQDVTRISHD